MDLEIDLRADVPYVRDQEHRSTCLAFAVSAAHTHYQCQPDWLSVEYLFYHALQSMPSKDPALGLTFPAAERALRKEGQPNEIAWPYKSNDSIPPMAPPKNIDPIWRAQSTWAIHQDADHLFGELKNGHLLVLGIELSPDFYLPTTTPFVIDDTNPGFGGHAVLAVGVGRSFAGEQCIMVQNSWGEGWGDSGYAWLTSSYLRTHLIGHMQI